MKMKMKMKNFIEEVKEKYENGIYEYEQASSSIVAYLCCMQDMGLLEEQEMLEIYEKAMNELDEMDE